MLNCTQRLAALFSTDQALAHQWREIDHSNGQDCLPGFCFLKINLSSTNPFIRRFLHVILQSIVSSAFLDGLVRGIKMSFFKI